MSRRRWGHGWTSVRAGEKHVEIVLDDFGLWRTTGEARGWRRCGRCRCPIQPPVFPSDRDVCLTCWVYALRRARPVEYERTWRRIDGRDDGSSEDLRIIRRGGEFPRWRSILRERAAVAQLVEPRTRNAEVDGSTPSGGLNER